TKNLPTDIPLEVLALFFIKNKKLLVVMFCSNKAWVEQICVEAIQKSCFKVYVVHYTCLMRHILFILDMVKRLRSDMLNNHIRMYQKFKLKKPCTHVYVRKVFSFNCQSQERE